MLKLCFLSALLGWTVFSFADNANSAPPNAPYRPTPSGREEIAFRDDRDLYDRNYHLNDWNYQQNWQSDPSAYLRGQNQPSSSSSYYQSYSNPNRGYQNNYNYNDTSNDYNAQRGYYQSGYYSSTPNISVNPKNPRSHFSWDYRTNWRYNRDAYLRGVDQSDYEERIIEQNRRARDLHSSNNRNQNPNSPNNYDPNGNNRNYTANNNTPAQNHAPAYSNYSNHYYNSTAPSSNNRYSNPISYSTPNSQSYTSAPSQTP